MKVMVVGGGGREHAIAAKISESPRLTKLYAAPGSDGMSNIAEAVPIKVTDAEAIVDFAEKEKIDMVFIGPEVPLLLGLADALLAKGIMVLGPSKAAAELEGSKAFSKGIMKKYNIPTGDYRVFTDSKSALDYLAGAVYPIVVKADGLAAGKGVIIAEDRAQAEKAVKTIMEDKIFGDSGSQVVVEEFLEGEELSLLAFTDGKTVVPMIPSQDHKRIFDNDKGPNTGGMGAYAPAPIGSPAIIEEAMEKVMKPLIAAMAKEGKPYKGVLYAGLMVGSKGVQVLEFNARFGDPETQAVLPLLDSDLITIVEAINKETLGEIEVKWKDKYAACVVMAAEGYPEDPVKGDEINGLGENTAESFVFHAGTKKENNKFYTNGGRVLGVTAIAPDLRDAIDAAYKRVRDISFRGMQYRKDIGAKAFVKNKEQK
ncbi:MAG: phosphoribosylamine--glycine ligase [Bacillota bacterium]|nr:phosphoribosylamine--glycine ligase [Bacillota bacterium]